MTPGLHGCAATHRIGSTALLLNVTPEQAVGRLLEVLPEFGPDFERSDARPSEPGDHLLLHVLMSDLARFYMREGRRDDELAARFWRVVEELASQGDEEVENAVWVSLIEWFAWGDDEEKAALVEAGRLQGPQTKAIRAYYLIPDT
jgi:hypothetical protein